MESKWPSTPSSISVAQNSHTLELKEGRLTRILAFSVLMASFGSSFQMGYHIGCINIPADIIKEWFTESYEHINGVPITAKKMESIWAVAVGIFAIGGMFGGIMVGTIADRLGRPSAVMTAAKYVGVYYLIIIGRFIIGLNIGLNSGLSPMYLTEISPINMRGSIGSIHQLFVTISILASQIMGLPYFFGTAERWPLIFAFTLVPVLFQLVVLPFCPESPKFSLIVKGRKEQAENDLKRLRGANDVRHELEQINEEAIASRAEPQLSMRAMLRMPLLWPLVLAVFMMLSQQLSGINAAMFYSYDIFKSAGLRGQWPDLATLAMGAVNVLMTFISVVLMERLGRRTLHITGLVGMLLSSAFIAISMLASQSIQWFSYFSILFVLLFVISAAIGPGAIPWFFVNEIFPLNARGNANSIAVLSNWGSNAIVGFFFPILNSIMNEYVFFVFTAILVVFVIFAAKFMPETKNKTLDNIQIEMDRRRGVPMSQINANLNNANGKTAGKDAIEKV
uniref:Major facilitator superfamily (MFS) profile domain-containing protein n=1 Tax=Globodera rostochiensis TaxID=31243 RepID=A0A914HMG7_GLORO